MLINHQQMNNRLQKTTLIKLFCLVAFVYILTLSGTSFHANELSPVDNIKPTNSAPSIGSLPKSSSLSMKEKQAINKKQETCVSGTSWWAWLTNSSKKPANFHYIDIIELLS